MNKQRRLVRRICVVGMAGILASGVISPSCVLPFTEGLAAEEGQVAVLTPDKLEILKSRMSENPQSVIVLDDGTVADLAYVETLLGAGESLILKESVVSAYPELLRDLADIPVPAEPVNTESLAEAPENAAGEGLPANNGTSENAAGEGASADNGTPENAAGTDGSGGAMEQPGVPGESGIPSAPGDAGSSDVPDNAGGSGDIQGSDVTDIPGIDESDVTNGTEEPGQSEDSENPGEPDDSNGTEEPEAPDNPDESGSSDKPGEPGNPDDGAGNSNGSGSLTEPDISDNSGILEKPDGSDNAGDASDPEKKYPILDMDLNLNNIIVDVDEFKPEEITPERISNAEFILNNKLVKLPKIVEDFRFWTVARKYAFANEDILIREKIPEEEVEEETVRAVGSLKKDGLLYILKEENNGWLYVESGRVRGFVRRERITTGLEANQKLEDYQKEAKRLAEEQHIEYTGIEDMVPMAEELVSWRDNEAFTYLRATVDQTVVGKRYALAKDASVEIKEEKDTASRAVGVLPQGGLCYVLEGELEDEAESEDNLMTDPQGEAMEIVPTAGTENEPADESTNEPANELAEGASLVQSSGFKDIFKEKLSNKFANYLLEETKKKYAEKLAEESQDEWIYVESGNVRGFVRKESLSYGEEVTKQIEETEEKSYPLAEEKIKPEDNAACYYTLTSTKPGTPSGEIRKSMVEFAAQFIGNPYVWGGTSLTEGADCSGFVQSIYKQYGYDLPRVACDQAEYGIKIPVEDALPGDLIFYARNGYIHHVVMYAGGGKTIEAMSTNMGIVQANVRTNDAVWATRVLDDNGYEYAGGGIGDVNATPEMYGMNLGTFELTYYCACELCCDVETGITATGTPVVEGRTIAVDPRVIPYGTQVIIGGHIFTAEDCGGAIKGNHIDVYVNDHAKAQALGVNYANVYLKK